MALETIIGSGGAFTNQNIALINRNAAATTSLTGTETLTNKTLTSPTISSPTLSGTAVGTYTLGGTPTLTQTAINSAVKVLAANATYSATVTPAALTGFSWTVVPGTYVFEVNLPTTMTTNGGLSLSFVLTTAVLTSIQYQTYAATAADNTTAVSTSGTTATSATNVFSSKTAAYTGVSVRGSMVVGTGGTFAWFGCQETSAGAGDATIVALGAYASLMRVV